MARNTKNIYLGSHHLVVVNKLVARVIESGFDPDWMEPNPHISVDLCQAKLILAHILKEKLM